MQCQYAYFEKGIPNILCRKERKPKPWDKVGIYKAMCGHQRYCASCKNGYQLTPTFFRDCAKLVYEKTDVKQPIIDAITSFKNEEETAEVVETPKKTTAKKKTASKD